MLGIIIGITLVTTLGVTTLIGQHVEAATEQTDEQTKGPAKAPPAISGDNVYVAWWTYNTANKNEEVLFKASTDGGSSFVDKINLSNTNDADSTIVEIDSDVDSAVVTWWETNQTSDAPVMRVITDNGATFGPMLVLATNGTIGDAAEAEPEEGE